jgi:tetratricopeptide (TPR) repeat protein
MKKYVVMSSVLILGILVLLSSNVLSQRKSSKADAFHESMKQETAQDYKKSLLALEGVYKDNKDDYLLNLRLGWLNYLAKKHDESKDYYSQAFALSKNKSIEALLGRTLPLSALNDWDGVAAMYNAVLKIDPMNYTANLRLGQILLNKAAYVEAKIYLEKAHAHYPGLYEPNLSLGWTYYYLGDRQKATALLTAALMLSPNDTLALKGLGLLK